MSTNLLLCISSSIKALPVDITIRQMQVQIIQALIDLNFNLRTLYSKLAVTRGITRPLFPPY